MPTVYTGWLCGQLEELMMGFLRVLPSQFVYASRSLYEYSDPTEFSAPENTQAVSHVRRIRQIIYDFMKHKNCFLSLAHQLL
jgi:hypothetical protein